MSIQNYTPTNTQKLKPRFVETNMTNKFIK